MKMRISWSRYNAYKNELMAVNNFWILPIISSSQKLTLDLVQSGDRVLEIGASKGDFKQRLERQGANVKTMDVDTAATQDFYDITEVTGEYDLIAMFATIEHIALDDFVDVYLPKMYGSLKSGGKLVITFPSPFHVLFTRTDITHQQGYAPRDLYALLRFVGFSSGKVYRATPMQAWKRSFFSFLSKYVLRPYSLDFIPELCIVMTK